MGCLEQLSIIFYPVLDDLLLPVELCLIDLVILREQLEIV